MILFLFGSGFTFKGIADVFINFYQFEVTTSTDVTTKDSVTFPAISICNLNKYYLDNLVHIPSLILLCHKKFNFVTTQLKKYDNEFKTKFEVYINLGSD
jgi:hypothetical protein